MFHNLKCWEVPENDSGGYNYPHGIENYQGW